MSPDGREKAYAQLNAGIGQTEELEPSFSQLNFEREATAVGPDLEVKWQKRIRQDLCIKNVDWKFPFSH